MKKIMISLLIIMCMLAITTPVFAMKIDNIDKLQGVVNPSGTTQLTAISGKIIGMIYVVATIVAISMLLIIGIKYITSSPDQKADLKARAVPYLIGAALIFGAANILKFIEKISTWIQ